MQEARLAFLVYQYSVLNSKSNKSTAQLRSDVMDNALCYHIADFYPTEAPIMEGLSLYTNKGLRGEILA